MIEIDALNVAVCCLKLGITIQVTRWCLSVWISQQRIGRAINGKSLNQPIFVSTKRPNPNGILVVFNCRRSFDICQRDDIIKLRQNLIFFGLNQFTNLNAP